MVDLRAVISLAKLASPADAHKPRSKEVLVLMAAGMASLTELVVPPCWNEDQPISQMRPCQQHTRRTHNHGVETSRAESLRSRDQGLSSLELSFVVTLDLDSAGCKGRSIIEANISAHGWRRRQGQNCC